MEILNSDLKDYNHSKKKNLHPYLDKHLFKKMKIRLLTHHNKEEELPIMRSPSKKEPSGNKSVEEIRENKS